jgi:hypothetical protein
LENYEDLRKIDESTMDDNAKNELTLNLNLNLSEKKTKFVKNSKAKDESDDYNENDELYSLNEDDNDDDATLHRSENDFSIDEDLSVTGKVHASINQYKQKYLGSVRGLREFRDFLKTTNNGQVFLKFWLDCEFFRDSMQDYDQIENMATRNRLFRDINERFVFPFSDKMHEKVRDNYLEAFGLNHNVFSQIQYDVLRRLRSYWIPRYILNRLRLDGKDFGVYPLPPLTPDLSRQSTYSNSFVTPPKSIVRRIKKKKFVNVSDLNDEQIRYAVFVKIFKMRTWHYLKIDFSTVDLLDLLWKNPQ